MYKVALAHRAKKNLKHLEKSGNFNKGALGELITLLMRGEALPAKYRDHALKGNLERIRECHLAFDVLVAYENSPEIELVTIIAIGSHQDLFKN